MTSHPGPTFTGRISNRDRFGHSGNMLACLIVAPQRGYDEPGILSYAISSFSPTSADGLHSGTFRHRFLSGLLSGAEHKLSAGV